ncbi:MAG: methylmalonyl-CoA epimerase [Panacagrimonas sp.]
MSSRWRPRRIDHIGAAVRSIAEASRFYEALGLSVAAPEALPRDGVTAAFVTVGTVRIELLEPSGTEGPIARYLARRGEGIHHIALAVDDIAEALEHARGAGFTPVDDIPRAGALDCRFVFLHPKDTHGVLIELVQTA